MRWPWSNSISQRILWGFYVFLGVVLTALVIQWVDLSKLQWRLAMQEATGELVDTVLEIRRYEKNWFLYREPEDFRQNNRMVQHVYELLAENREEFDKFFKKTGDLANLEKQLLIYRFYMNKERRTEEREAKEKLVRQIREAGKELERRVRIIRREEASAISRTIDFVTYSGLAFGVVVTLLVIAMGHLLAKSVVRPLRQIVNSTRRISKGEFNSFETVEDVAEIAMVHQAFRAMLRELEAREEQVIRTKKLAAVGTLVAGVAHELNNPLSNIGSSAQILLEEIGDDEPADPEFLETMLYQIVEQTDRARRTVRSLLEFSREKEVHLESLLLSVLFEDTHSLIKGQIPTQAGFRVEVELDGTFWADKQRIQQVLVNLLLNAFKACEEEEEPRIIMWGTVDMEEDNVVIQVIDNGPGIPEAIRDKIFDPFFTTKEVGEGSGLGLAVSHEIIRKHQGTISVVSEEGQGTSVIISLPMTQTEEKGSENHGAAENTGD